MDPVQANWYFSPFRTEKTPSFQLYDTDDRGWYDHGPKIGGDVFRYVQVRDNCSFKQAVSTLAARLDMVYASDDAKFSEEAERYTERRQVLELQTKLAYLAHSCLATKIRRHLIENVGLSEDTIDLNKIGYCPESFYDLAIEEGHKKENLLKTGYFVQAGSHVFCVFSGRILFPYWTKSLSPYAIGRQFEPHALDEYWISHPHDRPKYKKLIVHSDKHPYVSLFVANDTIFGEDEVRRSRTYAIFTEGITDAMSLQQIDEPCGSFVTTRHREKDVPKLIEVTKNVTTIYICNDNDTLPDGSKPGLSGALEMAAALFAAKKDVRLCELPNPEGLQKVDVNDFIRKAGPDAKERWKNEVLDKAKTFPVFLMDSIPEGTTGDALGIALGPLKNVWKDMSPLAQDDMSTRLTKRFKLKAKTIKALFAYDKAAAIVSAVAGLATAPSVVVTAAPIPPKVDSVDPVATGGGATPPPPGGGGGGGGGGGPTPPPARQPKQETVRGEVADEIGYYCIRNQGFPDERISSFSLILKKLVLPLPGDAASLTPGALVCCDVVFQDGSPRLEGMTFPKGSWVGRKEFMKTLDHWSPRMQWMGDDNNIQGVKSLLMAQAAVPTVHGCSIIGYAVTPEGEARYVTPQGTLSKDGWMEDPDVVYVSSGASLQRRCDFQRIEESETKKLAKKVLPRLLKANTPSVIVPILGHCFASPYKKQFQTAMGHFPILAIAGTQGSGKTTVITRIFWKLQGISKEHDEPFLVTQTDFATLKTLDSTNSIWTPFDEFKPSDMGGLPKVNKFRRLARCAYSGAAEDKGRPDLSTVSFALSAPFVVMGEAHLDEGDPALSERVIPVHPNKNQVDKNAVSKRAFRDLSELPLHHLAPSYAMWVLNHPLEEYMPKAIEIVTALLERKKDTAPTRCIDNMVVIVVGVLAFEAWADSLGVDMELPEQSGYFEDGFLDMIAQILNGTSPGSVKDTVDHLMEEFSVMAHQGLLRLGKDYILRPKVGYACASSGSVDMTQLYLHLPSCLSLYQQWIRTRGEDDRTNGRTSLRRMLSEKLEKGSYVTSVDAQAKFSDGSNQRCVVIDQTLISPLLQYACFPDHVVNTSDKAKDDD